MCECAQGELSTMRTGDTASYLLYDFFVFASISSSCFFFVCLCVFFYAHFLLFFYCSFLSPFSVFPSF